MSPTLLIVAKVPPPIGGVTIHNNRLMEGLIARNVKFTHLAISCGDMVRLPGMMMRHNVIHLQTSSPWLRLAVALLGVVLARRTIITVHGRLKRWNAILNGIDYFAVMCAKVPIVLNRESYEIAKRLNRRSRLMSVFIPPSGEDKLPDSVASTLTMLRSRYTEVFCTNAFNVTFDKNGHEIYGISHLVAVFVAEPTKALVVSDPTGNYARYLRKTGIEVPPNVLFVCEPHSFYEILKLCDAMVRATTTDGDAVSVREALHLGVTVFASDCVSRPDGCCLFESGNWKQLAQMISAIDQRGERKAVSCRDPEVVDRLITLYRELEILG